MSEKEIKNNEVAGKKLEDLTDEELKALQGQGDVEGEVTPTPFIIAGATVGIGAITLKNKKR